MIFTTDILIKNNTEYFHTLRDNLGMTFMDSFLLGGVIGFLSGEKESATSTKEDKVVNIPRTVMIQRSSDIEFALEIIYILSHQHSELADKEVFRNAFETNDLTDEPFSKLEKVKTFTEYAIGGVKVLADALLSPNTKTVKTNAERIVDLIEKYSIKSQKEINYGDYLVK